nr:SEC-C metal-binding domain-containing protein [Dorea sp. Marseille-P4042]
MYPNDLCPCGSGEKHKKCCGKNSNGDFNMQRQYIFTKKRILSGKYRRRNRRRGISRIFI